jgi:hypothetical protein
MHDLILRAAQRQELARHILFELDLIGRWKEFGAPVVVGAVAYDLVVSPDIDMEIYCPDLRIEHGFSVLSRCALHPSVTKARFANELAGRDRALYWQLRYRPERPKEWSQSWDKEWKVDMWSAPADYDLPMGRNLVEPLRLVLTPQTRAVILELKEQRRDDLTLACPSIDLYRAVLDDGVRTAEDLRQWLSQHETGALTGWLPRASP